MAKKRVKRKHTSPKSKKPVKKWQAAPLKGSFMVLAIVGFLISSYLIYPKSFNFGIASMLIFTAMFIAALISMTKAPVIEE